MKFETYTWNNYVFRQAAREDCSIVHELMLELSDYENMQSEFKSTPKDLENILFDLHCGYRGDASFLQLFILQG